MVYTRCAYMESLRIKTPAYKTTIATFTYDVTFESGMKSKLQRFTLCKEDEFNIAILKI
jgi:hypothetical protein